MIEITDQNQDQFRQTALDQPGAFIGALVKMYKRPRNAFTVHPGCTMTTSITAVVLEGLPVFEDRGPGREIRPGVREYAEQKRIGWELKFLTAEGGQCFLPGGLGEKVNWDEFMVTHLEARD